MQPLSLFLAFERMMAPAAFAAADVTKAAGMLQKDTTGRNGKAFHGCTGSAQGHNHMLPAQAQAAQAPTTSRLEEGKRRKGECRGPVFSMTVGRFTAQSE